MTELVSTMRPPDGEVIRSSVVFDRNTYNTQRSNRDPFIGGPVGEKQNRVLRKEILWSPRPGMGLGRTQRASVRSAVPAFSVLNGIGNGAWNKHTFFSKYYYTGLATGTMEFNAINTDSGIYSAVDRQGLTWMTNNGPKTIQVGDIVMVDIPISTENADTIEAGVGPPEGGTPEQRHTAFPVPWNTVSAIAAIKADLGAHLRGRRPGGRENLPSTPAMAATMRAGAAVGMMLAYAEQRGIGANDVGGLIDELRDGFANNPGLQQRIVSVMGGAFDLQIAALLTPRPQESLVPGARLDPDAAPALGIGHNIQRGGTDQLLHATTAVINEAGRDRVIGRAINTADIGRKLSILLFG